MRVWAYLLGGLLIWAVHFFGLYIIASVFLTSDLSRALSLVLTAIALVAAGILLKRASANRNASKDRSVSRWVDGLAFLGAAIALVAILWQALPAIIV